MTADKFYGNESDNNCTQVDQLVKWYYLPIMYSVIFAVGFVGNTVSIVIYVAKMRPWKSTSIITLNLAFAELLYVLSMPFLVYYYANGDSWTMGEFMCRFVRFGFHVNLYGSILFLACLAVFRYVAVAHPLRLGQMQRKRWGIAASALVWVVSCAEIAPILTAIAVVEKANRTHCLDLASHDPDDQWWHVWLLTVLGYVAPLVVVFACYSRVARALAEGTSGCRPGRTRARRLVALILALFVVCFAPYHVLRLVRADSQMRAASCAAWRWVHAACVLSRPVVGLNTFFNLALYTLAGDRFQRAFLDFFWGDGCLSKRKAEVGVAVINTPVHSFS